jgi:hypothetical protein
MTFEKPEVVRIGDGGSRDDALCFPVKWVILVATVLVTVGQTLQQ